VSGTVIAFSAEVVVAVGVGFDPVEGKGEGLGVVVIAAGSATVWTNVGEGLGFVFGSPLEAAPMVSVRGVVGAVKATSTALAVGR
jgi:hypothetical protein